MSVRVPLDNIHAGVTLGGGVDLGLDDINLGGGVDLGLDNINLGGSVDVGLDNINLGGSVDVGLDNINLGGGVDLDLGLDDIRLKELPTVKVEAAIKELPLVRSDSKVDLGLDNIRIREFPALKLELALKPLRLHLPLNYKFCIEVLGIPIFKFALCGEGMAIAEDYVPRETETCR